MLKRSKIRNYYVKIWVSTMKMFDAGSVNFTTRRRAIFRMKFFDPILSVLRLRPVGIKMPDSAPASKKIPAKTD
jgi:hypothetical protein